MNLTETGKILAVICEVERRELRVETTNIWHRVIGHLTYEVANEALVRTLRTSRYAIKPADLLAEVPHARAALETRRGLERRGAAIENAVRREIES